MTAVTKTNRLWSNVIVNHETSQKFGDHSRWQDVKKLVKPPFRARVTTIMKKIIGKNHDFDTGELSVSWSEGYGHGCQLAALKLSHAAMR